MRGKEVIEANNKLYEIYRVLPEEFVTKHPDGVDILKKLWHCDRAFKNKGKYYFVRDIIDVEYETINSN